MRRTWTNTISILATLCLASVLGAQDDHGHSDVEFAYEDGRIAIEFGDEGAIFEGEFPLDGIDRQFTGEPGFGSELEEGLGIHPGDQIAYNVLSDLLFWNEGFKSVTDDVQIRIVNRPPSPVVPDTVVSASSGIQMGSFSPAANRIGAAEDDGDFHSDLDFMLEPMFDTPNEAAFGAYGILMSLSSDNPEIADSEPFAMIFNYGLDEAVFEEGVESFAAIVPEPSHASLYGWLSILGFLAVRRRTK